MTIRARNVILFWVFLFAYFLVSATFVGCGPEELRIKDTEVLAAFIGGGSSSPLLEIKKGTHRSFKELEEIYDLKAASIARWRAAAKVVWIVWAVLVVAGILATPTLLLSKSKLSVVMEDGKQYPFFGWTFLRELGAAIIANIIVQRKGKGK